MPRVHILPDHREVEASQPDTLPEVALDEIVGLSDQVKAASE